MRRLLPLTLAITSLLACEPSWVERVRLDERLDRGASAAWDLELRVGADTLAAVAQDGGELTLTAAVEGRYPYLLGPVGLLSATLDAGPGNAAALADEVPHRRVDVGALQLDDLLATACADALTCAPDTADTGQSCVADPCAIAARLTLRRGDEPGRLRTWITIEAALDPVPGFERPELSLYAVPR